MKGNLCRSMYVQKEQKDVAVGEIIMCRRKEKREGRKCRKMEKDKYMC